MEGAVELAVEEVATADHGEDGAGFIVDDEGGALEVFGGGFGFGGLDDAGFDFLGVVGGEGAILGEGLMGVVGAFFDLEEAFVDGFFGVFLEALVDAGEDLEATDGGAIFTDLVDDEFAVVPFAMIKYIY